MVAKSTADLQQTLAVGCSAVGPGGGVKTLLRARPIGFDKPHLPSAPFAPREPLKSVRRNSAILIWQFLGVIIATQLLSEVLQSLQRATNGTRDRSGREPRSRCASVNRVKAPGSIPSATRSRKNAGRILLNAPDRRRSIKSHCRLRFCRALFQPFAARRSSKAVHRHRPSHFNSGPSVIRQMTLD
jgi:hypothetical protein